MRCSAEQVMSTTNDEELLQLALDALRSVEWVIDRETEHAYCPDCGMPQFPVRQHQSDCDVAHAIRILSKRLGGRR